MIKAKKLKLPSMTISIGVLHEAKDENSSSPRGPAHLGRRVVKGFGSKELCRASVWRLKEEGALLSFTIQISMSVFWRTKVLLVGRCDPKWILNRFVCLKCSSQRKMKVQGCSWK